MKSDAIIGTGWQFPPAFSKADYSTAMTSGPENIRESLEVLLSTLQGERIMLPDYGSGLQELMYENITNTLVNLIKSKIELAILYYEPRITTDSITIRQDPQVQGLVWVDIVYVISVSNERASMVYPFYLNEGTTVPTNY